ncbi:hypothetical protein [Alkalinema sp. FACHB-956]|uniref:hypothetical protein n=1 Tax=Alkalinema sp. FACHB-956 TaxID=2692768 RepID=UPI0016821BB6|nr:hypothetical protein [Alkalinema sp. FACHB-956]MBD2327055.1 hypothetical protein [Alkalinema sp. FACHB-956]
MNFQLNRKWVTLVAGMAVLASPLVASSAFARPAWNGDSGMQIAQLGEGKGDRIEKLKQELNLSQQQIDQIKQIRQSTRSQIEALLTPEQKAQIKAAAGNRQGRRGGMKAANLTDAQKAQMKEIMKASREKMKQVLTPEQQAKLQQKMQERRGNKARTGQGAS